MLKGKMEFCLGSEQRVCGPCILREIAPSRARESKGGTQNNRWTCAPRVQGCCHDKGDPVRIRGAFHARGLLSRAAAGLVCYPLSEAHRSSRRDVLEQVGRCWAFQQSLARVRLTMSLRRPSANLMRHILGQSGSGTMPSVLSVTVMSPAASPDRGEAPDVPLAGFSAQAVPPRGAAPVTNRRAR
jgi:hypothetical protein